MTTAHKPITIWLFFTAFMVFAMAVIGAVTRLTESGLSITEWKPLVGALPPLSEKEWYDIYDLYTQSPEFIQKHSWMELEDFKKIFFWEWFHRLWGRLIGLVFALPLLYFWIRKKIPSGYGWKFLGLLALGGAQGAMGWIMVQSGLIDRPSVSHYRLATHLILACIIFAALLWVTFDLWGYRKAEAPKILHIHGWAALGFLALTITWGAFTAGLDAGMVYNTFPTMNEHWLPPEPFHILENHGWVQFTHRLLATATLLTILSFWLQVLKQGIRGIGPHLLAVAVMTQFALGIATLLTQVYIPLAAAHQAGALILLGILLYNLHQLEIPSRSRISR